MRKTSLRTLLRLALGMCVVLPVLPAAVASPPRTAGMNEAYQPTNAEFLARSEDGTEPLTSVMGGATSPLITLSTSPAADTNDTVRVPVHGRVTFDASGTKARHNAQYGGTRIVAWIWDFQDGSEADAPVVTHQFDHPGVYRVTLVVHDDTGWQAADRRFVYVGNLTCGHPPQEIWIPTGHGLVMEGTLTVPTGKGPFPTILEYGPYVPGQTASCDSTILNGYARAWVSAPGRGNSTGEWDMFGPQTQRGGYDAVEWFARQPWSNGKVGLYGLSGPAVAALLTAAARPPHLATVVAMSSYADLYRDMITAGGVPNSDTFVNAWLQTITVQDAQSAYNSGSVPGIGPNAEVVDHGVADSQRAMDLAMRPFYDGWWKQRSIVSYPHPTVPILYYGNQRDLWPRSTAEIARWIAPAGGRVVYLPGGHANGDVSGWEAPRENNSWNAHYLKGIDNGSERRPRVLVQTTYGGDPAAAFSYGRWDALDGFLTHLVRPERLFLRAASTDAERPQYHGLSSQTPPDGELPQPLLYSPMQGATSDDTEGTEHQVSGLQESWEAQSLVYETPVLTRELTVMGPAALQVYARVLAPEMAFTVQVDDVWPDGSSHYISKGELLASHRALDEHRSISLRDGHGVQVLMRPYHPHTKEAVETLLPGQAYRFDVEIWGIANAFRPGHRLRLVLAAQDLGWRTHAEPGLAALVLNDRGHPSSLNIAVLPAGRSRSPFPFHGGGRTTIGRLPVA
jgi:predicted acyl esterase